MGSLLSCMPVHHRCLQRSEEGFGFPGPGVMVGCKLPCGYGKLSLGPLQEQVLLSRGPSLQQPPSFFWDKVSQILNWSWNFKIPSCLFILGSCAMAHEWLSEENFQEQVLTSHQVCPRDGIHITWQQVPLPTEPFCQPGTNFLKNRLVAQASFELLCSSQWPWSSCLTSQWQNYRQRHQAWIMLWWDSTPALLHAKQALYQPSYIPGE